MGAYIKIICNWLFCRLGIGIGHPGNTIVCGYLVAQTDETLSGLPLIDRPYKSFPFCLSRCKLVSPHKVFLRVGASWLILAGEVQRLDFFALDDSSELSHELWETFDRRHITPLYYVISLISRAQKPFMSTGGEKHNRLS